MAASLLLLPCVADAASPYARSHPMGKVARIFNTRLVELEQRIAWLNTQLISLVPQQSPGLESGFGSRCGRLQPDDPDPAMTVDMGKSHPLETIYLVPSQKESVDDESIFPRLFTLEVSENADFQDAETIYASDDSAYPDPDGSPVRFMVEGRQARYIRLTVHSGHARECSDLFGLSELVAVSRHQVVTFGAAVSTTGALNIPRQWYPEALTDGSMPLGLWENIKPSPNTGDKVEVSAADSTVSWQLSLKRPRRVNHLVLFPYQINASPDSTVFPDALTISIGDEIIYQWNNRLPGSRRNSPLVIPLHNLKVKDLKITATAPCQIGTTCWQALSEIEIWSDATNLALDLPVTRTYQNIGSELANLTDGYSSTHMIIPVTSWLEQLHERNKIEQERNALIPLADSLATRSEMKATWGSAIMLGLTFLIPVALVERRRFLSRSQMEKLQKRIASDLHDDIGSHLGSISLIARTARKDLAKIDGPKELVQDLGEMETIAHESALAMRDIAWMLEKDHNTVADLIQRIREISARQLSGITHAVHGEIDKPGYKLSLDAKRHLFLFYKEAVQNILKNPQAKHAYIRISDVEDKLALEISDDGGGLPANADQRQALIHKLEERSRMLDGSLQIHSSTEQGTTIRLLVKRSHLNIQSSLS